MILLMSRDNYFNLFPIITNKLSTIHTLIKMKLKRLFLQTVTQYQPVIDNTGKNSSGKVYRLPKICVNSKT